MRLVRCAVTLAPMGSTIESPELELLPGGMLLLPDEEKDDVDAADPSPWAAVESERTTDGVFPGVPCS